MHRASKRSFGIGQGDAILWPFGAGNRRLHACHVELQALIKLWNHGIIPPHPLRLGIGLNQSDRIRVATGETQIIQGLIINGEQAAGGAILRSHVGDSGAIGQRQLCHPRTIKLDKFPHHAVLAQHLHYGEHQIGGGSARWQRANKLKTHHLGHQHRDRLPQHRRLSLNAANTPAQYTKPIDHGRVRIGADQRVGIGYPRLIDKHGARQCFKIDLVHNPHIRGHHLEVVKRLLSPFEEAVSFTVTGELHIGIVG